MIGEGSGLFDLSVSSITLTGSVDKVGYIKYYSEPLRTKCVYSGMSISYIRTAAAYNLKIGCKHI